MSTLIRLVISKSCRLFGTQGFAIQRSNTGMTACINAWTYFRGYWGKVSRDGGVPKSDDLGNGRPVILSERRLFSSMLVHGTGDVGYFAIVLIYRIV